MAITLEPQRTAVMAMDFQNDILGMTPDYQGKNLLGTVKTVLETGRRRGSRIIYITVSFRPDYTDAPVHCPLFQGVRQGGVLKQGTAGAAICDELRPEANDIVINKHCVDPFNGTHLHNVLRNHGLDTLVLTGVWTNYVVEATARTGADSGYRIIVVTDGCASNSDENHQFFVNHILPTIGVAATANEVVAALG